MRVVAARCDAGYIALQLPLSWRERSTRARWGKGVAWDLKIVMIMPTLLISAQATGAPPASTR